MKSLTKYKDVMFSADSKKIAVPAFIFIVTFICLIYALSMTITRIKEMRINLNESQKMANVLTEKLESIRRIDKSILDKAELVLFAIPDDEQKIYLFNNVRRIAYDRSLALGSLQFTSSPGILEKLSTSALAITFTVNSESELAAFIESINKGLPVMRVYKLSYKSSTGQLSGELGVDSFWGDLPDKIPPITEPIKNLSTDEKELLGRLSRYVYPSVIIINPNESSDRQTPFN